MFVWMNIGC